ncbi:MAG: flagellar biosynthesis protein FlhB [Pseudomonadota bacterium]
MAEEAEDGGEKTEDPTQKRLDDAHKKGDVAKSQEVNTWFVMAASAIIIAGLSGTMASNLMVSLGGIIEHAHQIPVEGAGMEMLWRKTGEMLLLPMLLPMAILAAAGLIANLVQHPPLFATEPITPKLSKISPIAGFWRLFSLQSLLNFAKGVVKISLVSAVLIAVIWPERDKLDALVRTDIELLMPIVQWLVVKIVAAVLILFTVIAVADYAFEKWRWIQRQKMTIKEVKDEFKAQEGDPQIKSRIRQLRQERARKRMMAAVPSADVIVTNPTHYSIALKYERGMNAPVVVAKGIDEIAFRIREVAKEHDIPLFENAPLARALYATVEIDQEIPQEHYKAVADVISYVMKLAQRRTWQTRRGD